MQHRATVVYSAIFCFLASLFASCSSPPPVIAPLHIPQAAVINLNITASSMVNSSNNGIPSPIKVTVLQLSSDSKFTSASFSALISKSEASLGASLQDIQSFYLKPSEKKVISVKVKPNTKVMAITAAFKTLNQTVWRKAFPIGKSMDVTYQGNIQIDVKSISGQLIPVAKKK